MKTQYVRWFDGSIDNGIQPVVLLMEAEAEIHSAYLRGRNDGEKARAVNEARAPARERLVVLDEESFLAIDQRALAGACNRLSRAVEHMRDQLRDALPGWRWEP